jgi:hypothetical protein
VEEDGVKNSEDAKKGVTTGLRMQTKQVRVDMEGEYEGKRESER